MCILEGLEMRKRNTSTGRTQTVDQKNRVIYLVIMFTASFVVIKMSKMALIFVPPVDGSIKK